MTRPFARAYAAGAFDDVRSRQIRFLEEAARLGPLSVSLWSDEACASISGSRPKFSLAERRYYLESLRFVERVEVAAEGADPDRPAFGAPAGAAWAVTAAAANAAKESFCREIGIAYRVIDEGELAGFPYEPPLAERPPRDGRKRVIVTGCFDWLHTGHLRFFEEAAGYGELNVVIGSDANVRLLKGEGHPLFPEAERRYVAGASRFVARCLVATGSGWLDAEPEIRALGIARYLVNEDGDRPEKRRYCEAAGIEYIVLERNPKDGLPRRSSTDLRGF